MASNNKTQTYDEVLALIKQGGLDSSQLQQAGIDTSILSGMVMAHKRFTDMQHDSMSQAEWVKYVYHMITCVGASQNVGQFWSYCNITIPYFNDGQYTYALQYYTDADNIIYVEVLNINRINVISDESVTNYNAFNSKGEMIAYWQEPV